MANELATSAYRNDSRAVFTDQEVLVPRLRRRVVWRDSFGWIVLFDNDPDLLSSGHDGLDAALATLLGTPKAQS